MSRISRYLLCLLLLLCALQTTHAQQYAISVNTQIIPPYSVYLPDYAVPGSDKLRVIIVQNDLTKPAYDIRLQMTVEQNGTLIMRTSPAFNPKALTLSPGVPTIISGADLYDYLNSANIEFSGGFSRDEYERTKSLPEGAYRISFTAYDYHRPTVQVSNIGANVFFFRKNDPPLLNLPVCGSRVDKHDPQFVSFSWSSRNSPSPVPGGGTEYVFSLYEIKPAGSNPDYIVRSARPIFTTVTETSALGYGPGEPALIDSMTYVWTVQARDKSGHDLFTNQGLSRSCTFTYLGVNPFEHNPIPKPVLGGKATGSRSIQFTWSPVPDGAFYKIQAYRLQYRPTAIDGKEFDWLSTEGKDTSFTVNSLEPEREYEGQLQLKVADVYGPFSNKKIIKTAKDPVYVCGDGHLVPQVDKKEQDSLLTAISTDIISIGDFDVQILQVTGGDGVFSGTGKIISGTFTSGLLVKFDKITINKKMRVWKGEINGVTIGIDSFVTRELEQQHGGNNAGNVVTGDLPISFTSTLQIMSVDDIKVDLDKGKITITDPQTKETQEYNYGQDGKTLPVVIADKDGDLYQVAKDGKVTYIGKKSASLANISTSDLNKLQPDKGKVTFSASPKQVYAFDSWNSSYSGKAVLEQSYEAIGTYRVSTKAIVPNAQEEVIAKVDNANGIDATKIKFVSGKGIAYPATLNDNQYTLLLTGGPANDAQDIYAVYQKDDGTVISVGKLHVASYDVQDKEVMLIPVGEGVNVPEQAILKTLETVYKGIGVNYKVTVGAPFLDRSWDANKDGLLEDTKSALLSNGFTGEELALKKAYLKTLARTDDNTAYLFVLNQSVLADGEIKGRMPRTSQFGFIFTANTSDDEIARTVAHQVGHGVYTLEHTFEDRIGLPERTTTNLMDNGAGLGLLQYQWDMVHDPGKVWGIFESDADASTPGVSGLDAFEGLQNNNDGVITYTFITPAETYITLPATASNVIFATLDKALQADRLGTASGDQGPLGALISFELDGVRYAADISGGRFNGYKSQNTEGRYYQDAYTWTLRPGSGIGLLLAVESGSFTNYAGRYVMSATNTANDATYTGAGTLTGAFSILHVHDNEYQQSVAALADQKKAEAYPLVNFSADNLFFNNYNINFTYKAQTNMPVSDFLEDNLEEETSFINYLGYYEMAVMKPEEVAGLKDCSGRVISMDKASLRAALDLVNKDAGTMNYNTALQTSQVMRQKVQAAMLRQANSSADIAAQLRAAIAAGSNVATIHQILVNKAYQKCVLNGLTFDERKYMLNQLLDDNSDVSNWYVSSSKLFDDASFILRDLFSTAPQSDRQNLVRNGLMENQYKWLRVMWKQANNWYSGAGYDQVHALLDLITPWIRDQAGVQASTYTFSSAILALNNETVYPGIHDQFLGGMQQNEEYQVGIYDYRSGAANQASFNDDGKVYFHQAYNIVSGIDVVYDRSYDPFEPVTIVAVDNFSELGFSKGQSFTVPAFMGMVYERDMQRTRSVRKTGGTLTVVTAKAVSAAGVGNASIPTSIAALKAALASADQLIQGSKVSGAQYAAYYDRWNAVKTVVNYAGTSVDMQGQAGWVWSRLNSAEMITQAFNDAAGTLDNIPDALGAFKTAWNDLQHWSSPVATPTVSLNDSKLFKGTDLTLQTDAAPQMLPLSRGGTVNTVGTLQLATGNIAMAKLSLGIAEDKSVVDIAELWTGTDLSAYEQVLTAEKMTPLRTDGGYSVVSSLVTDGTLLAETGSILAVFEGWTGQRTLTTTPVKRIKMNPAKMTGDGQNAIGVAIQKQSGYQLIYANTAMVTLILKKLNQSTCTVCRQFDNAICTKFEDLKTKVDLDDTTALKNLCKQLDVNNVNAVLDYMLNMNTVVLDTLMSDLETPGTQSANIINSINHIDVPLLQAWELMNTAKEDAYGYHRDYAALHAIVDVQTDAALMSKMGNKDGLITLIKANTAVSCNTCLPNPAYGQVLSEYFNDLKYFSNKYDIQNIWAELKLVNKPLRVLGASFELRILRAHPELFSGDVQFYASQDDMDNGDIVGYEDRPATLRSQCGYDVKVNAGAATHYYEFKSWDKISQTIYMQRSSRREDFAKQLEYYLHTINSLDELTYIFDGRRLALADARAIFQKALTENIARWYDVDSQKLNILFKVGNLGELNTKIANLDSELYKVVTTN